MCSLCAGYVLAIAPEVDPINLGSNSQYIASNKAVTPSQRGRCQRKTDWLAPRGHGASLAIVRVKRILRNNTRWRPLRLALAMLPLGVALALGARAASPPQVSGIYPQLAFFNDGAECGTGAVVPWADRLWAVTYSPHEPRGSSDKLYEITPDLRLIVRPESVGGTPANRMIHAESGQLFLGPYAIDRERRVRVIPYAKMFGRPTGNARHLTDPANRIYCASMEEALYEVDVHTLAVTELWADEQVKAGRHSDLPGYHGKGLYSGQGRIIYANNGEHGQEARSRPEVSSGCLAEWDGKAAAMDRLCAAASSQM